MENDIEKGDVDIFRDTPVRYLGIYLFYMFILLPVDAACMLLLSELFYVQDSILDKVWRGGGEHAIIKPFCLLFSQATQMRWGRHSELRCPLDWFT